MFTKKKVFQFICCVFMAILFTLSTLVIAACSPTTPDTGSSSQSGGNSTNSTEEFTVTFHYGFDPANFDETTGYPSQYTDTYEATVKSGKKFSISSTLKNRFDCVDGYKLVGYDTQQWNVSVTANMDVRVKYEKCQEVTVTFLDALGDEIKQVVSYEGGSLNTQQLPDTSAPVYLLNAEQYGRLSESEKGDYEVYAKDANKYILTADKARLGQALVLPLGNIFTGWEGQLAGFTQDVTITPATRTGTAVISHTSSAIAIDGEKEAAYTSMGKVWRKQADSTDYSVSYSDTEWDAFDFECELFMTWDGDYMYFYVDITDNHVISFGENYNTQIENPFVQDNIEIWYSLGGNRYKLILDAFGYKMHSVAAQTSGNSAYFEDFVSDNYVTKLKGADLATYKTGDAVEATGATGWVAEFAIPCYFEPTSSGELSADIGGENWGEAMVRGDYFYVGLQADTVDAIMSSNSIQTCINTNNCNSADATFESTHFNAFGYQITSDKRTANAWLLVLG